MSVAEIDALAFFVLGFFIGGMVIGEFLLWLHKDERAGMPDVHYDELAIQHGQQVTVTFKDPADAFALFNEIRERGHAAILKEPTP